MAEDAELLSTQ